MSLAKVQIEFEVLYGLQQTEKCRIWTEMEQKPKKVLFLHIQISCEIQIC